MFYNTEWTHNAEIPFHHFGKPQLKLLSNPDPRILLVDDDGDQLMIMQIFLESCGYAVLTATNATQAIEELKKHEVDAIVTDAMMPEISGLELISLIRKTESIADVPAIVVTAGREDIELEALKIGADMFCAKCDARSLLPSQIDILLQQL